MKANELPHWTLRRELIDMLAAHYEAAEEGSFPPISPVGLMEDLNSVGPVLGPGCLPVVEMPLDGLHRQGLVGRMPAPSPRHTPLYMCREASLAAQRWNRLVILMPLTPDTP
ncbi:MAG: hypothetical protein WCP21_04630 [Armatimonadota bacterium]